MTVGNESPISAVESMNLGLPFWLPPFGRGNGLQALYWACLADLPERLVTPALAALGAEDIAGWASPVHSGPSSLATVHSVRGRRAASHRHGPAPGEAPFRLWVATLRYEKAEDIMLRVLNDGR